MQSPCFLRANDPQRSGRFPVLIRVAAIFPTHTKDIHSPYGSMYAYCPEFRSTGCNSVMTLSMQRLFQPDMLIQQSVNEILCSEVKIIGDRHSLTKTFIMKCSTSTWWRHQMETFSALLALCAGPGEFPHKGQWRGTLMFSFICAWVKDWVNNCEPGDLRCHHGHYDVNVMNLPYSCLPLIPLIYVGKYL